MAVADNQTFFPVSTVRSYKEKPTDGTKDYELHECPEPGCSKTLESMEALDAHMVAGHHEEAVESESVYDKIRRQWADCFSTITVDDKDLVGAKENSVRVENAPTTTSFINGMGLTETERGPWSISTRTNTIFNNEI